jgi:hypothetical protein
MTCSLTLDELRVHKESLRQTLARHEAAGRWQAVEHIQGSIKRTTYLIEIAESETAA